jgi:methylenetetrahydrofolate dehydrogenase (NADP+)/methenyltetrahydrofolate cyclohydrolase
MTARILDGRALAERLKDELRARVQRLHETRGIVPGLCAVFVDQNPPSRVYAQRLARLSQDLGIHFHIRHFAADVCAKRIEEELMALNADDAIDGILVEMPLPPHLPPTLPSHILEPRKDVDGITTANAGRLYLNLPGHAPSCAVAMMEMLKLSGVDPAGKHAVVVGRSNVVGKPVTMLLLNQEATVTNTHRGTVDLAHHTRQADILMVAAGEPKLIRADMVKPGATVIDAGINVVPGGIVGDVDFEGVREVASAITPVPGGVGPVTNMVLLRGVVESAEQRCSH